MGKDSKSKESNVLKIDRLQKQIEKLEKKEQNLRSEINTLKERNFELEKFFGVALDLLCIADTKGYFRKLNSEWEKTLGYSIEELEGKLFLDFVHPDDLPATLEAIKDLSNRKNVINFINRYRCKNGSYRWIEWRSTAEGEIIFAAARDISERLKSEELVKLSESRLRQIIDLVPHFIFAKDRNGKYILGNKCIADSYGVSVEDMIGKTDFELNPKKSEAEKFRFDDQEVIQKGEPKVIPLETITYSDGSFHYLSTVKIPFILSMSNQDAVLGVSIDITEIKRIEEALRESEEKFRELTDLLPQPIYECDSSGNLTFVNQQALKSFGYTVEDFKRGFKVTDMIIPDEVNDALDTMERIFKGEKINEKEYTALRKDGSTFPVIISSSPINHNEKNIGLRGIILDITEQKKYEESLKQSEERFKSLLQNASDVIAILNSKTICTYISPSVTNILGYPQNYLVGRSPLSLIHPDDLETVTKEINDAIFNNKSGVPTEFRFLKADGSWIYFDAIANNLLHYSGIDGLVITCRDITERKRATQSLSDSERQFRSFLNSTDDLTFLKDGNGKYIFVNYTLAEFFEKNHEEILGKTDFELMPIEAAQNCHLSDLAAFESDDVIITEEVVKSNIYETRKFKIQLGNNQTGIGGFIRDITEKKKLEKQIIQNEKMAVVGQLAGGIAHDLNNILTALIGNTELLERKICSNCKKTTSKYVEALSKANSKAKNIILQILAFSKGQPVLQEITDLNDIVSDIDKMLTRLIPENIKIAKDLDDNKLFINADISQVEQIIMNLVINARDAVSDHGTIEVSTKREMVQYDVITKNGIVKPGEYALLSIKDNGTGISQSIIDKIFDPFFTTKEPGRGTGLGLSVVLNNINKNGAFVNLYSEPDRGTQFKIYFPLITEEEKSQAGEKDRDLFLGNGQTILIVEDDDGIRYMLTEYLQELNYKIIIANNGVEALQLLNEKKVDAVLTDLTMPDMGGMELYKNIKQRFSNIPIIAMSGYYDYKELQNIQFDDLLEKPLDMSKVSIIFNKVLRNS